MRPLLLALPLLLCLPAPEARASGLRCGTKLVSEGNGMLEVVGKCGEPAQKQARTEVVQVEWAPGVNRFVERRFEEWTYNFGPRHFLQTVVFVDGVVVDVRSGNYGF